ncbi:MAG: ParA family protein, partial [Candidatus Thorarchaeota archaeon]
MNSNQKTKIIMVHSYKGGTGKTAIAINLAQLLAMKKGVKVLLIEQDTGGSTFSNVFKTTPPAVWNDFYLSNTPLKDLIIHHKHFDIICAKGKEIAIPEGESTRIFYSRHLERFRWESKWLRKNYEYIIL